jgi:DNA-binding MarR family transcriptional regulator
MNEQQTQALAGRLHCCATQLVRRARTRDSAAGLSAARLSALSATIAAGSVSLAELAAAEKVQPPTMSRLVDGMVRDGLLSRETNSTDRRSIRIRATAKGVELLSITGQVQMGQLASRLDGFADSEKRALLRGVELMERLTRN